MKAWTIVVILLLLVFALITIFGSETSYNSIVDSVGGFVNTLGDTGESIVTGFGRVIKGEQTLWSFLLDWVIDLIESF